MIFNDDGICIDKSAMFMNNRRSLFIIIVLLDKKLMIISHACQNNCTVVYCFMSVCGSCDVHMVVLSLAFFDKLVL